MRKAIFALILIALLSFTLPVALAQSDSGATPIIVDYVYSFFNQVSKTLFSAESTTDKITGSAVASTGSCVGHCGAKSTDCWCDSYCTKYKDCCSDYGSVCGASTGATLVSSTGISCTPCKPHDLCNCSLSAACNSGFWIINNKIPDPAAVAAVSNIPPSIVKYTPVSTGELNVFAVCLNPLAVKSTSVTVTYDTTATATPASSTATTIPTTTTTTTLPSNCDSQCKAQGFSSGTCRAGTPSPSSTNLAPIPDDWYVDMPHLSLDASTTHNGNPSIRIGPDYIRERDCIGFWYNLKPGDHVVLRVWIKTGSAADPSKNGDKTYGGGRLGIDLYGGGEVLPSSLPGTVYGYDPYVPFGSDWTLRSYDFIVPDTYYDHNYAGQSISPRQVDGCIPWLQVMPLTEQGVTWFADAELYINPTSGGGNGGFNAVWVYQNEINTAMLQNLVSHKIFNVFLYVGYPNPTDDPALTGIVPAVESGIVVSQSQVTDDLNLLASVDSRLRLWAWVGTFSSGDDATGHANAKVDISTSSNRAAIINAIVKVAKWGFYGVQDDTEDITANSADPITGQMNMNIVNFWNDEAIALHNIGVKLATFTPSCWYNFNTQYLSQLTGIDYHVTGSGVGSGQTVFNTQMTQFMANTNIPVIIDIESDNSGNAATLISWLDAWPVTSYPNVVGFALYNYGSYTSNGDWTAWDAWAQKDGGVTGGSCQSGETSIGKDGCSSGICCCSGAGGECTPANDIIKQTDYPTGSCLASTTSKWSHSSCGNEKVCKEGYCKLVDAELTSYTLPSGKYARSDTISIPYTIKNTGDTPWCFLTQSGITKADSSSIWPTKFNSVSTTGSATDSLSYQVSCSDPLGTWSGSLYSTTDYYANGGWNVWNSPSYSFNVVGCLNDQDCTNCKGSGYTCDLATNNCAGGGPSSLNLIGMDSNWWWFGGIDTYLDTIQQSGGNTIHFLVSVDEATGIHKDKLLTLRQKTRDRGMLLSLSTTSTGDYAFYDPPLKWKIINNIDGYGDQWIAKNAEIISVIQPDVIDILTEPYADEFNQGYTPTSQYKQNYINFCVKAIDTWRAIKPDLTCVVQGIPFWDLKTIVDTPIPRPNVIYTVHTYYVYGGDINDGSWYSQWNWDYWNGNLATAKTHLYQDLLQNVGIQAALNKGLTVTFEALGCHSSNPNALQFMKDAFDFCDQYDLDFIMSGNSPNGAGPVWIYNSDGTLNKIGQLWKSRYGANPTTSIAAIPQCSSLNYPSDRWQRVWYTRSTGSCLGDGPDEAAVSFDNNWGSGVISYSKSDDIQLTSSRTINMPTAGTYTFSVGSDDGVRLWIDDVLKIDKWVDRSYTTDSVNVYLSAGNHRFRLDFYENKGDARLSFSYTTPTTTTLPVTNNLAAIPDGWMGGFGNVGYWSNTFWDYNVERTAGKPSIRIERHTNADTNYAREVDGHWYSVKPGDHIVAKVWIKTGASGFGDTNPYSGARTGIDLYYSGPNGEWYNFGGEATVPNYNEADWYVHWGTSTWTLRTIDFVVPNTYFNYNYNSGQAVSPVQANRFVFWLQVWSSTYGATDPGLAWFADPELYINP